MSPELFAIAAILAALAVGVVSPGPSFVLVARISVAVSRRDGLAAAIGMGLGGVLFATLALVGLIAILAQVAWLYTALKVAGGLYLLYLAVQIWRGAAEPIVVAHGGVQTRGPVRSFWLGLATQISTRRRRSSMAVCLPPSCRRTCRSRWPWSSCR